MDMPKTKKPYEKYFGRWVSIVNGPGNYNIKGLLRGIDDDGNLVINPYTRIVYDSNSNQTLQMYPKDIAIQIGNVGMLSEVRLRDLLQEIWEDRIKVKRESKKDPSQKQS